MDSIYSNPLEHIFCVKKSYFCMIERRVVTCDVDIVKGSFMNIYIKNLAVILRRGCQMCTFGFSCVSYSKEPENKEIMVEDANSFPLVGFEEYMLLPNLTPCSLGCQSFCAVMLNISAMRGGSRDGWIIMSTRDQIQYMRWGRSHGED